MSGITVYHGVAFVVSGMVVVVMDGKRDGIGRYNNACARLFCFCAAARLFFFFAHSRNGVASLEKKNKRQQ